MGNYEVFRRCTAVPEQGHDGSWTDVYWQYYADGSGYVMDTFQPSEMTKMFIPAERIDNLLAAARSLLDNAQGALDGTAEIDNEYMQALTSAVSAFEK